MIAPKVPPGHVRAVVERPYDDALAAAAADLFREEDPTRSMLPYVRDTRAPRELKVDPTFGAIPIGSGNGSVEEVQKAFAEPGKSERFLVSGFVEAGDQIPTHFDEKGEKYPIYSNPLIGGLLSPCLPTCGTSKPVGTAQTVRTQLDVPALRANGLDGSGVGLAIVDSGIYVRRIQRLLGQVGPPTAVNVDVPNSWRPPGLVTRPFDHRLGHGTMCAYDALIAAPNATLLDFPMLLARPVADHHSTSMADAALHAYARLAILWWVTRPFDALVVSNSWGVFHPCLEDFPPGHPYRFIDNPDHALRKYLIRPLSQTGMDIIFCGNNCGNGRNCAGDCASGTCLSKTDRMIMGPNTYEEVLTVGGCDTNDQMVGYSSLGPSIAGMYQPKPDLVAYTHFLGSRTLGMDVPDTGVSAACPVAAGCVAALRTRFKPTSGVQPVLPRRMFQKLRDTAYRPTGGGPWSADFGYGIVRPVAAYQALP
jgi:Subtilase family